MKKNVYYILLILIPIISLFFYLSRKSDYDDLDINTISPNITESELLKLGFIDLTGIQNQENIRISEFLDNFKNGISKTEYFYVKNGNIFTISKMISNQIKGYITLYTITTKTPGLEMGYYYDFRLLKESNLNKLLLIPKSDSFFETDKESPILENLKEKHIYTYREN